MPAVQLGSRPGAGCITTVCHAKAVISSGTSVQNSAAPATGRSRDRIRASAGRCIASRCNSAVVIAKVGSATQFALVGLLAGCLCGSVLAPIVAPAQVMLKPDIKNDERIAASHLIQTQLRHPMLTIRPADWYDREAVSADDGFQWHLDGQVEVMREQRLNLVYDVSAVGLESVGRVVVAVLKQDADASVDNTIKNQLQPGVTICATAVAKPGAKGAVVTLLEHPVVKDEVPGRIRHVRHHDRDCVSGVNLETGPNRVPESRGEVRPYAPHIRIALAQAADRGAGPIATRVVDHDDFVVDFR